MNIEKHREAIALTPVPVRNSLAPWQQYAIVPIGDYNRIQSNRIGWAILGGSGAIAVLIIVASVLRPPQQPTVIIKQDPVPVVTPSPPQSSVQPSCSQWCFSN